MSKISETKTGLTRTRSDTQHTISVGYINATTARRNAAFSCLQQHVVCSASPPRAHLLEAACLGHAHRRLQSINSEAALQ